MKHRSFKVSSPKCQRQFSNFLVQHKPNREFSLNNKPGEPRICLPLNTFVSAVPYFLFLPFLILYSSHESYSLRSTLFSTMVRANFGGGIKEPHSLKPIITSFAFLVPACGVLFMILTQKICPVVLKLLMAMK